MPSARKVTCVPSSARHVPTRSALVADTCWTLWLHPTSATAKKAAITAPQATLNIVPTHSMNAEAPVKPFGNTVSV